MRKFVLVIGGSDSSGGSGVQADLRALQFMGMPAACVVTAVTAQGINGVSAIQLVDPKVVSAQIEEAFTSYHIKAVKIGMLGSAPQVQSVISALRQHPEIPVVLDPVLESSSGTQLLDDVGRDLLLTELISISTVVMPNVPELGLLSGMPVETADQRMSAAHKLLLSGVGAVMIKGGHLEFPEDILIQQGGKAFVLGGDSVRLRDARGTGCVLSSFMAANLARENDLWFAMTCAKRSIQKAIAEAFIHASHTPGLMLVGLDTVNGADLKPPKIEGIYFVTGPELNPEVTSTMGARFAVNGGARIVQLRDKRMTTRELVHVGIRMKESMHRRGAMLIVNDRVDIALAIDADGVHLGPEDMDPEEARQVLGWRKLIGASVGTLSEAKKVAKWVDYLAVGAIFGSLTKGDAGDPVGVERITEIKRAFHRKPVVAIGGINLSNIASVAAAGADAAAVVSAIVCAPDPEQATRDLLAEFERGRALQESQ